MSTIITEATKNTNPNLVNEDQQQDAYKRFIDRTSERDRIASQLRNKSPFEVDNSERAAFRKTLIDSNDEMRLEAILGKSDLFPFSYLEIGLQAGKSVCRIEVRDSTGKFKGYGTGFLISPRLLLTNNHVLNHSDDALRSLAQFQYEQDAKQNMRQTITFNLAPQQLFMTNRKLDFSLVAIEETSSDSQSSIHDFGYLPLYAQSGKALVGEYLSVIQHPSGEPKAVSIRENKLLDVSGDIIHYSTDTLPGSSGSPVFNDEWIVVALHHAGIPDPNIEGKFIANEGIRISSILRHINNERTKLNQEQQVLISGISNNLETNPVDAEEFFVEELSRDWYEGAAGYDSAFLGAGYEVPHPQFSQKLEHDIAPLLDGGHILNYRHFSIVMSKSRQLAIYTVVNVDGNQLVDIDRVKSWYVDPRIDKKYQSNQDWYVHADIDRGHLVRRLDPVWGSVAEKANKDTFHFTNCSPQHKDLNQKTWVDLENYILDKADNLNLKITVFTGPVFREDDLLYKNKFKFPAEFWKIVVMVKEDGQKSATAYLQTQKDLIKDLEFFFDEYKTYQVPIKSIEEKTGLDFGDLRKYDPAGGPNNPAGRIIERLEEIVL